MDEGFLARTLAHNVHIFPEIPKAPVQHILRLVGEEHLAIGTYFQGVPGDMKGSTESTEMCVRSLLLFQMGSKETQVRKILILNFLRVFKDVTGK